ncbi:hypothetical protein APLC1_0526 [Limnospira platensis C1]|nr:hypothetical protein APLC1_0526 [Arthrospira platensis C1]
MNLPTLITTSRLLGIPFILWTLEQPTQKIAGSV